jgi:uncharacterized protein (DUF486 family)
MYEYLKFSDLKWFKNIGLIGIVFNNRSLALFEYFIQVPANKIGYSRNGVHFSLMQLKVKQGEIICNYNFYFIYFLK